MDFSFSFYLFRHCKTQTHDDVWLTRYYKITWNSFTLRGRSASIEELTNIDGTSFDGDDEPCEWKRVSKIRRSLQFSKTSDTRRWGPLWFMTLSEVFLSKKLDCGFAVITLFMFISFLPSLIEFTCVHLTYPKTPLTSGRLSKTLKTTKTGENWTTRWETAKVTLSHLIAFWRTTW